MLRILTLYFVVCTATVVLITNAFASTPEALSTRLESGGYVLMIRHANAPGSGDPPHFQVDDCSTQRNLDDLGRAQSQRIGQWLRSRGINNVRVYSSQWCRCLETARLMAVGPVVPLPALNSFYERPQDRAPNLAALRRFLSRQPLDGDLIVLVTHYVTISAITGEGVSSGEGVVIELGADGVLDVHGRLGFE
jgi:phosphohistidine phosphatase SixA